MAAQALLWRDVELRKVLSDLEHFCHTWHQPLILNYSKRLKRQETVWKGLAHEDRCEVLNAALSLLAKLTLSKQTVYDGENEGSRTDVVGEVVKAQFCIPPFI